jgi:hypothetical protein
MSRISLLDHANAVHDVLATLFPRTLALFDEKVK